VVVRGRQNGGALEKRLCSPGGQAVGRLQRVDQFAFAFDPIPGKKWRPAAQLRLRTVITQQNGAQEQCSERGGAALVGGIVPHRTGGRFAGETRVRGAGENGERAGGGDGPVRRGPVRGGRGLDEAAVLAAGDVQDRRRDRGVAMEGGSPSGGMGEIAMPALSRWSGRARPQLPIGRRSPGMCVTVQAP